MHETTAKKVAHQIELERLYSKNQLMQRLRGEFSESKEFNFQQYLQEKGIPVSFGIDVLAQIALHKRADMSTMIGVLRHHFLTAQETADMLLKAVEADLLDWSPVLNVFIVRFTISDDVQAELDKFQYPLPMVVEPKFVRSNRDVGYMLSSGSIILKHNHHENDVCLDHINRVNKIKFTIDLVTVNMVKNKWRNLDKAKPGESKSEFQRRQKAFEKYDRTAKDVINLLIQEGNEFYLTHKYDKRGRIYAQGYHVNYQGAPWNKAVINFASTEVVSG